MGKVTALGRIALAVAVCAVMSVFAAMAETDPASPRQGAVLAALEGPIGPAATRHVEKLVAYAADRGAEAIVLRIDTPGGLADSMRDIISEILSSPIPVIGYVAPPGAHAASAGTYILYATHLAAMAPGTNLGSATPVSIGGPPGILPGTDDPFGQKDPSDRDTKEPEDETTKEPAGLAPEDTMTAKVTNDAVAFIRSLAELHNRNADWAESAVREAANLSAEQALELGVINLMAKDVDDVLAAADGQTVNLNGTDHVLATRGVTVERYDMDGITRLLSILSNPNVALLLMMLGVYGIIFEFWNPGAIAPGAIGAISLMLGLYALNQLPLDYAGLALIGIGVAFMVAEAFTPSFGILGFSGLVAFVLGATMLVDTDVAAFQISWWVIGIMAALSATVLVGLLGYTIRAYRQAPAKGGQRMVGGQATVIDWSGGEGFVWAEGERWHATGARDLAAGSTVCIHAMNGLTLTVGPDEAADPHR